MYFLNENNSILEYLKAIRNPDKTKKNVTPICSSFAMPLKTDPKYLGSMKLK
jgi:hypothetical protein